jgi:2,3-bisphosphoglycerate-independent phosphoglycerate mutase
MISRYGVLHGRFQPFHNDHLKFVLAALEKTDVLYIGITNPDPSSTKFDASDPQRSTDKANPFTFYERLEMITQSLLDKGIQPSRFRIVPFPINIPELWEHYAPREATYFMTIFDEWGEKKLSMLREQGLKTELLWKKDITDKGIDATRIRDNISNGSSWDHLVPAGTLRVVNRIIEKDPQRFKDSDNLNLCKDAISDKGKTYLIIVDGGADRPIADFEGKTPFEQAITPNLDHITQKGVQGLITIINDTICPESDNGTMALLSYDPLQFYTGRGPLEGLGADFIKLEDVNSISLRVNFASYNPAKSELDRRTSRDLSDEELQSLTQELRDKIRLDEFEDVEFKIISFAHHRGIVSFTSKKHGMSGNISNTDPGYEKVGVFGVPRNQKFHSPLQCIPLDDSYESSFSASVINAFIDESHKILSESIVNKKRIEEGKLPANMLLARDGGSNPQRLESFEDKFGKTVSIYGQIPAERGLALLINGKFAYVKMPEYQEEKAFLTETARLIVQDHNDVVCIHIMKSADEAGHSGDPHAKRESIERFDRYFLGELLSLGNPNDTYIVTCDHATPCELKIHSVDKVPVLISGPNIHPDTTQKFGESLAKHGELSISKAIELLSYVFNEQREFQPQLPTRSGSLSVQSKDVAA